MKTYKNIKPFKIIVSNRKEVIELQERLFSFGFSWNYKDQAIREIECLMLLVEDGVMYSINDMDRFLSMDYRKVTFSNIKTELTHNDRGRNHVSIPGGYISEYEYRRSTCNCGGSLVGGNETRCTSCGKKDSHSYVFKPQTNIERFMNTHTRKELSEAFNLNVIFSGLIKGLLYIYPKKECIFANQIEKDCRDGVFFDDIAIEILRKDSGYKHFFGASYLKAIDICGNVAGKNQACIK